MELTLVVSCLLAYVCIVGGTKHPANENQAVPKLSYQGLYSRPPKFSATRKYANTFSYKQARIGKSPNDIKRTLLRNQNLEFSGLVPTTNQNTGTKQQLSTRGAGGTGGTSQNQLRPNSKGSKAVSDLNNSLIDISSPVHQSLVSSIEKLIVHALGVDTTPEQKGGVITSKKANLESNAEKKTPETDAKNNVKELGKKSQNIGADSESKTSTQLNKSENSISKSNATSNGEGGAEKAEVAESAQVNVTTTEPTEPVQAEVTTPEPVEPVDPVDASFYAGGNCFCLPWCPPGTIFRGHCGMQTIFGYRGSMCCLPDFMYDDDDSD